MSQQIDFIVSKHKDIFVDRRKEIKDYLKEHYLDEFKNRIFDKIEKLDATDKIQTTGFRDNLSSWTDSQKNIIVSSCVLLDGNQKRYDYKISFAKEKFRNEYVEQIEKSIQEIINLKDNLRFKVAIMKIESATKLVKEKDLPSYLEEINRLRNEIFTAEDEYNKIIEDLAEKIKFFRDENNLNAVLNECEKIIEISKSINRDDLVEKYTQLSDEITEEMLLDKEKREKAKQEISVLKSEIKVYQENQEYRKASESCKKLIKLAKIIEDGELVQNYSDQLTSLNIYISERQKQEEDLRSELNKLDLEIKKNLDNNEFEKALGLCDRCVKISEILQDDDLKQKHEFIKTKVLTKQSQIRKEVEQTKREINNLKTQFEKSYKKNDLDDSINTCQEIISKSERVGLEETKIKYTELLDKLYANKEGFETVLDKIKRLNQEGVDILNGHRLIKAIDKFKEIRNLLKDYLDNTRVIIAENRQIV